jgi:hypothetical protein
MVTPTCFGITLPSSGSAPRQWTQHAYPQLSISQKALGTLSDDGNVMPKHVGAIIHN